MSDQKNRQFEEWLVNHNLSADTRALLICIKTPLSGSLLDNFYSLPWPMQWGVHLEYFDSIDIDLERLYNDEYEIYGQEHGCDGPRVDLQKAAVKKGFEKYKSRKLGTKPIIGDNKI